MWGGGIHIVVQGASKSNVVEVRGTTFINNTCHHAGGGMDMGYRPYSNKPPLQNTIVVENCTFLQNRALFGGGGGTSFYSTPFKHSSNSMIFIDCTWILNEANIGSALDMSPHTEDSYVYNLNIAIILEDSTFTSNYLTNEKYSEDGYQCNTKGRGAFLAVGYNIRFEGSIVFSDSAMYLTTTRIEFAEYS